MAKYPIGLLEEELKNKVAADWFEFKGKTNENKHTKIN